MIAVKETTVWAWPNHVYFTSDNKDKVFGYVRSKDQQIVEFQRPIKFDTRGRKFETVNNTWGFFPSSELKMIGKSWQIKGSKGDEYTVTEDATGQRTCSCTGFKFRGQCRHTNID